MRTDRTRRASGQRSSGCCEKKGGFRNACDQETLSGRCWTWDRSGGRFDGIAVCWTCFAGRGDDEVAFEATVSGSEVGMGTIDPNTLFVQAEGTGSENNLGPFSMVFFDVDDRSTTPPACAIGATPIAGSGAMIFTTGVLLFELVSGQACFSPPSPLIDVTNQYEFVGGIGAFDDAEGEFTFQATGNFVEDTFDATLSGTLELDD